MRAVFAFFVFVGLLFSVSVPVQAETSMGRLPNRGEVVPFISLTTIIQRDGESQDQYLVRLAQWMLNYTTGTNYEICGALAKSESGQLSVRLFTNNSHISCANTGAVAPGYVATGDSIHSHPVNERFTINDADRAFIRDRIGGGQVKRNAAFAAGGKDFSDQDYLSGPGYLVAHGRLLYQSGRGTSIVVATLSPAETH